MYLTKDERRLQAKIDKTGRLYDPKNFDSWKTLIPIIAKELKLDEKYVEEAILHQLADLKRWLNLPSRTAAYALKHLGTFEIISEPLFYRISDFIKKLRILRKKPNREAGNYPEQIEELEVRIDVLFKMRNVIRKYYYSFTDKGAAIRGKRSTKYGLFGKPNQIKSK
tara:strand:- start:407 stop:907 length:501 start_codon:yes stop_codon:yes gene_type:complete